MLVMLSGVGQKIVSMLVGFASRQIFIYYLGREFVGLNGLFGKVLSFLSLAELGIGSAITVYLYKPLAEKDENTVRTYMHFYKRCYQVIGWIVLGIGLCLVPFLPDLVTFDGAPPVNLYVVYLLFLANSVASYWFFAYKTNILNADQKGYYVNNRDSIFTMAASLLKCLVVIFTRDFVLALATELAVGIAKNIAIAHKADQLYPFIREGKAEPMPKEVLQKLFRDVRALFINNVSFKLLSAVDTIVISAVLSTALVANTDLYTMIINYVVMIIAMATVSLGASVGNLNARETLEKRLSVFRQLDLANFWVSSFSTVCLFQLLTPCVALLFREKNGADLTVSATVVACLVIRFYMGTVNNTLMTFKNAMGLLRQGCYLALFGGVLNVVLTLWMAQLWGLTGVFLSTVVSEICTTFFANGWYVFHDGFKLPFRPYLAKMVGRMAFTFAMVWGVHWLCKPFAAITWGNFILQCGICVIVPNLVLLAVFFKNKDFHALMERFVPMVQAMQERLKMKK